MRNINAEDVYFTLLGEMSGAYAVPGVENMYAEGSECDRLYSDMSDAYGRLRERLGVRDEDADVEVIINALLSIQHELCLKMFHYGQLSGQRR